MLPSKRKRSANFTQEEKLKFIRFVEKHGEPILTKVTSHDAATNKHKEVTWKKITEALNASSGTMRTVDTLKKLWQKLKTDAKIYKARALYTNGTGGGPSQSVDDPLLELVVDMTRRGSTGTLNVKNSDESCDAAISAADASVVASEAKYHLDVTVDQYPDCEIIITNEPDAEHVKGQQPTVARKRWQPVITGNNERSDAIKARAKMRNRLAAERLKAEREKTQVSLLQKQHMVELHHAKMKNEHLKQVLLETLIKKVKDGDTAGAAQILLTNDDT